MKTEPVRGRPEAVGRVFSISVEARPESIKSVRDFVAGAYEGVIDAMALYVLRTVAGELATNAVQHGGVDDVVVRTYVSEEGAVVEVWDRAEAGVPEVKDASDVAVCGRGVLMVEQLSARWGVVWPPGGGKIVWAVVRAVQRG
ncbi:ATP-binding protein [Actinomadura fibrosa]|uniref:ATP-binding protein n=1 Tax=Actinomadura fibrosa TaxID=111802 RepID=A0ABW2XYZ3_9ACTN|nr:ATP-binding protein [Actinomadura fibrosa]